MCFTGNLKNSAGNTSPAKIEKVSECYAELNTAHRFQGDIYPTGTFNQSDIPSCGAPYWTLLNRTCHLVEVKGQREVKPPFLNYAATYPLKDVIDTSGKVKEQISNILTGKADQYVFLPENDKPYEISEPLVINFNMIITVPIQRCPSAIEKCIQLSSPFCEHVFQKFSRYYYTVGYNDEQIRSKENITRLVEYVTKKSS